MEGIIIAVLSLLGTLGGSYFANKRSSALIAYRLEELEKKVDKHNSVVERTYGLKKPRPSLKKKSRSRTTGSKIWKTWRTGHDRRKAREKSGSFPKPSFPPWGRSRSS